MESKPCLKTVPKVVIAKSPSSNGEERIGLDGGWAWCVAFAACLINFIMAGLARMSGILYVAFIDMFHVDRKGASMPFSVRSSTRNLLGPVVGILGQKYGVRTVTIIGGIIGSLSAATCFFAEDIIWITVIWGGINERSMVEMYGPDAGWAWIVVCAALTINFITAGVFRGSGILYVAFIDVFQIDRKRASMPFTLRTSVANLISPFVGILGQKYGARVFIITGGILGTASAAACFFVEDVLWFTIIWGVFNGIAISLIAVLVQVVVGQYFKKYKTTAYGVTLSGGCIGSFFVPALYEFFLLHYGIEGTFLIIAGMLMHTIPAAMILKTPPWVERNEKKLKGSGIYNTQFVCKGDSTNINSLEVDFQYLRQNSDSLCQILSSEFEDRFDTGYEFREGDCYKTPKCIEKSEIIRLLEDIYRWNETSEKSHSSRRSTEVDFSTYSTSAWIQKKFKVCKKLFFNKRKSFNLKKHHVEANLNENLVTNKVITIQNVSEAYNHISRRDYLLSKLKQLCLVDEKKILSLFPKFKHHAVAKLLSEMQKLQKLCLLTMPTVICESPENMNKENIKISQATNTFSTHFKTALKLHSRPIFLLICACRAAYFCTFVPIVTTIVDYSIDKGLDARDGKYVIAALSVGDLFGRSCLGWVTDRGYASFGKYMLVAMVLLGTFIAMIPFIYMKSLLFTSVAMYGALQGSLFVRHPVLISKYVESDRQAIAIGCLNFSAAFVGFSLPSYIGHFRDTVGSYDGIYYINASITAALGLLWFFEPYLIRPL